MPIAAERPKIHLDRTLRTVEYFTLAFGTMVGVGWLVVIDDWLGRGGPFGAMIGFLSAGVLLMPIALVYARLVAAFPDAAGEVAYAERVYGPVVVFATGWAMTLAYLVVCPWEAVAIGKLLARLFPGLDSVALYSFAGKTVYLHRLLVGLALTALVCGINYRGIRFSSKFQNVCTFVLLAVFAVFSALGLARGDVRQLTPMFARPGVDGALVSVLLVLQVVPYFMTGFESVAKSSEEASADLDRRGFGRAIVLALVGGTVFYVTVLLVVPMLCPWRELTQTPFGTAVAFERAFGSRTIGDLIIFGAIVSLFKVFNGNFVAGTRMLYGMAGRSLVHPALGRVHERFLTPHVAIGFGLGFTVLGTLLGESVLIPISEVGSLAVAIGWLTACLSFLKGVGWPEGGRPARVDLAAAGAGAVVSLALIVLKVAPFSPGHLGAPEYLALGLWTTVGLGLWLSARVGR
ncbi:MAG: APC family permease [Candidatus Riflebacteria bacterium]|nr:APC family permease [Candidatus Riflebacteria bacterium]